LYLARHGQTAANAASVLQGSSLNGELNERGLRQAEALAQGLKDTPIDRIYASGLRRAIQTAEKCQVLHPTAPLTKDARLNEISWGIVDGTDFKKAKPIMTPVTEQWKAGDFDARIENGESAQECQDRIVLAVIDILNESVEKGHRNVLLCLHGRLLRVIMATLVSRDLRTMSDFPHTNCSYHEVSVEVNSSVTSLED
ncbi:phosphoglycerate mutase-like protein, partial [Linderina pennispora]